MRLARDTFLHNHRDTHFPGVIQEWQGTGIFTLLGLSLVYRMGTVPEAFATIIFALPPVARLTALSIRQVPKNVVVAAMISAGDLGEVVLKGIIQMKIGLGFEGGLPS